MTAQGLLLLLALTHTAPGPPIGSAPILAPVWCAPATGDALEVYAKRLRRFRLETGQRHLELGSWARDTGLTPQATTEFLYAVEVSENAHPGANKVLSIMRSLEGKFWKKRKPTKNALASYRKRARKALALDAEERLDLLVWADGKGLQDEAFGQLEVLLATLDGPFEFDAKGRLLLEAGRVPEGLATRVREDLVQVEGKLYRRSGVLGRTAEPEAVVETATEPLRVRGPIDAAVLADLHALGEALLEVLEVELDGAPTRTLEVFVFADRESYEEYLAAEELSRPRGTAGFADGLTNTAVICGEGLGSTALQAIVLHELTHLASYAVNRAVLPSWYTEGIAEAYGGRGTFTWDGDRLEVGGELEAGSMSALLAGVRIPLEELTRTDIVRLWSSEPERVTDFYLQSWAFVRYLRQAPRAVREPFEQWERQSRGASLGAVAGQYRSTNASRSQALFEERMADVWGELETGFAAYFEGLRPGR